jgi:hypothetical protein
MQYIYVHKIAGKAACKIGITGRPERRYRKIDGDLKRKNSNSKLVTLLCIKTPNARDIETAMHRKYAKNRFSMKDVSGGTEFFQLGYFSRIALLFRIRAMVFMQYFYLFKYPAAVIIAFAVWLFFRG